MICVCNLIHHSCDIISTACEDTYFVRSCLQMELEWSAPPGGESGPDGLSPEVVTTLQQAEELVAKEVEVRDPPPVPIPIPLVTAYCHVTCDAVLPRKSRTVM